LKSYLLDTNVVSELIKPHPDFRVASWYAAQDADALFLSSTGIGEIVAGIEQLAAGRRRSMLEAWLSALLAVHFVGRVLDFDVDAALVFGCIIAQARRSGRPAHIADAQIAAVALVHDLTVATRDVADFAGFGVALVNPFEGA
jgi:toxin FitB